MIHDDDHDDLNDLRSPTVADGCPHMGVLTFRESIWKRLDGSTSHPRGPWSIARRKYLSARASGAPYQNSSRRIERRGCRCRLQHQHFWQISSSQCRLRLYSPYRPRFVIGRISAKHREAISFRAVFGLSDRFRNLAVIYPISGRRC